MRYISFASGSSGNCALISEDGVNILLDAGISAKRIRLALEAAGLSPGDISAIVLTHEHSDHIGGLRVFSKMCSAPVYASRGTAEAIVRAGAPGERIHTISAGEETLLDSVRLRAFATPHDAAESFGYVFESGSGRLAAVTDLGHVTSEVRQAVSGCDAVVLEANHDIEMLRQGSYPQALKLRILGSRGHLSNDSCAEFALLLAQTGTKQLLLAHLSAENNTEQLALSAVKSRLGDFPVRTAPRAGTIRVNV